MKHHELKKTPHCRRNILVKKSPKLQARSTVLDNTPGQSPTPLRLPFRNVHSGPNEDAGPAGQFRLQNCTRTRLVLESRCGRIEIFIPNNQNSGQNQSASKTVPELATHWHSRGPQSKLHASSAVLGWGLATTGGIGMAPSHLQYFTARCAMAPSHLQYFTASFAMAPSHLENGFYRQICDSTFSP